MSWIVFFQKSKFFDIALSALTEKHHAEWCFRLLSERVDFFNNRL
jgi:hypothetical protein